MPETIGVVVVGMGIAGRVRVRDILQKDGIPEMENVTLIGYSSRRQIDIEGGQQVELEAALQRSDVHCVIICTENETHEGLTRKCLEAGKHVLVEFPVAKSRQAAEELFCLAESKGLVLHEEQIALLSPAHQQLRSQVAECGPLKEAEFSLSGRFNRWIQHTDLSGSFFTSGVSSIQRQVSLFGELQPAEAYCKMMETTAEAWAKLLTTDNRPVIIKWDRKVMDKPYRATRYCYKFENGTVLDSDSAQPPPSQSSQPAESAQKPKYGLFLQDFLLFLDTVRGERDATEYNQRALYCLGLADQLTQLAAANPESSGP